MRRGPRPKPTKLKVLQGNPGKRPLNDREPEPEVTVPTMPEHLTDEAKAEWDRISPQLETLGLLSDIDRAALAAYCQAWSRWVEAEQQLKRYGVVIKSPNDFPIQSPFLSIANKALDQMVRLLSEFGMSPAARTRIHVDVKPRPQDTSWDKF